MNTKIIQSEFTLFSKTLVSVNKMICVLKYCLYNIYKYKTRMTLFIKMKFKKSDDKYRVAGKITEYHIISKLIFLKIIILKIRKLFHVKNVCKNVKKHHV